MYVVAVGVLVAFVIVAWRTVAEVLRKRRANARGTQNIPQTDDGDVDFDDLNSELAWVGACAWLVLGLTTLRQRQAGYRSGTGAERSRDRLGSGAWCGAGHAGRALTGRCTAHGNTRTLDSSLDNE
eukprot:5137759-Prymnesium_polylepis.1